MSKGYFVWNDLMTSDPAAVLPFYQGLLGWSTETSDMGTGPYTMFKVGDKHVGGVTPGHEGRSYWVSYISVDDVDAACKQIESLGGRIMGESLDVPGVGKMAYATDPNGAVFSPFQDSNPDYQPELPNGVQPGGAIAWHEVSTPDQKATDDFYSAVFGWDPIVWPMGEDSEYHGLRVGETPVAGVFKAPDGVPAAWTIYFEAPGTIQQAVDDVRRLGGQVLQDIFTVEGTGDITVVADPAGAVFGIMKSIPMGDS